MDEDAIPDAAVAAAGALRVFVGRLRRQMQEASAIGELSSAQASALARIVATEGPSSTSALAGAERVRPQSMAETVAVLEGQGLIRREPDPTDGRRQLIFLTEEGRAYGQGVRASRREWLAQALAQRLTESELGVVSEALTLLERVVDS